jgi:hypothetical protein
MEQHQGYLIARLHRRGSEYEGQHGAGRIGRSPGCGNDEVHGAVPVVGLDTVDIGIAEQPAMAGPLPANRWQSGQQF